MSEKIRAIIKEPGKPCRTVTIANRLENFQKKVGGWIECFYPDAGGVMIVNDEGAINGMPKNCRVDGVMLYGTIVWVGEKDGEFTDCPVYWDTLKKSYPQFLAGDEEKES